MAIATGDVIGQTRLAAEYIDLFQKSNEFLWELMKQFGNMSAYEEGKIVGRVLFELVTIVLPFTKVGHATKVAVLNKIKTLPVVRDIFEVGKAAEALGEVGRAGTVLDDVAQLSEKMCFAAGTKVHTDLGLRNIEEIRRGDKVLSRDPISGVQEYKPVLQTFVTHPSTLYTLTYRIENGSAVATGGMEQVVTTAPHPFWVANRHAFIATSDLRIGDELRLADGTAAQVITLTTNDAPAGTTLTTYNFEVADFHTYFVGSRGVWVHNTGRGLCESLASLYRQIVDTRKLQDKPWEAFKILLDKTAGMPNRVDAALPNTVAEVMRRTYKVARKADGTIDLAKVPSYAEVKAVMAGRMAPNGLGHPGTLHANHTVPRYVQKLLGITDETVQDSAPALLLTQAEHTGVGESFHNILYRRIPKITQAGEFSTTEIYAKLEEAYNEFGRSEVWPVAKRWLDAKLP